MKQISTVLPSSAVFGTNLALYKGPSQVMAFTALQSYSLQTQKTHSTASGDRFKFTFLDTIKLAEISIYVENGAAYSGKNFC